MAIVLDSSTSAVQRKLQRDLLPILSSSERLTQWGPYRIHAVYFWAGEVFVLLVGLGVSHPLLRFLTGQQSGGDNAGDSGRLIANVGEGIVVWASIAVAVIWGMLKIYVMQNDLPKKASLIKSAIREFRQELINVEMYLQEPNPMPMLKKAQEKVLAIQQRLLGEGAWPWRSTYAPGIERTVATEVEVYVKRYSDSWTDVPSTPDLRRAA